MTVERAVRVAPATTVQLDHGWELCRSRAGDGHEPRDLESLPHDEWLPALVPGTVAQALRAAGRWDWTSSESLDTSDWWYRVRFASAPAGDELLCLDGLATLADVWLNGKHVLRSDSMFAPHRVRVGALLRAENELVVKFSSLREALAERRPRPRWKTRLVEHQSLRWFRTTLLGRMPGWSNGPEPVGAMARNFDRAWAGRNCVRCDGAGASPRRRRCDHRTHRGGRMGGPRAARGDSVRSDRADRARRRRRKCQDRDLECEALVATYAWRSVALSGDALGGRRERGAHVCWISRDQARHPCRQLRLRGERRAHLRARCLLGTGGRVASSR